MSKAFCNKYCSNHTEPRIVSRRDVHMKSGANLLGVMKQLEADLGQNA
jgi:hypothetical protein